MIIVTRTSLETKDPAQVGKAYSMPAQGWEGPVKGMSLWCFQTLKTKRGSQKCPESRKQVTCKKVRPRVAKDTITLYVGLFWHSHPAFRMWTLFDEIHVSLQKIILVCEVEWGLKSAQWIWKSPACLGTSISFLFKLRARVLHFLLLRSHPFLFLLLLLCFFSPSPLYLLSLHTCSMSISVSPSPFLSLHRSLCLSNNWQARSFFLFFSFALCFLSDE